MVMVAGDTLRAFMSAAVRLNFGCLKAARSGIRAPVCSYARASQDCDTKKVTESATFTFGSVEISLWSPSRLPLDLTCFVLVMILT
jgi:hypothetical protein